MSYNCVLRQIVISTNTILSKKSNLISERDIKIYREYMRVKSECPTRAKSMMKYVLERKPIEHILLYEYNKHKIEQQPCIKKLLQKVNQLEAKQKRTLYTRNFLINFNRVQPSYVTRKLTRLQKIILKIKMLHSFNIFADFS